MSIEPAAFRRLCVETLHRERPYKDTQPPSGGCVLKRDCLALNPDEAHQPPSGGCVLKLDLLSLHANQRAQPPSGGCVLKQITV